MVTIGQFMAAVGGLGVLLTGGYAVAAIVTGLRDTIRRRRGPSPIGTVAPELLPERQQAERVWEACAETGQPACNGACPIHGDDYCLIVVQWVLASPNLFTEREARVLLGGLEFVEVIGESNGYSSTPGAPRPFESARAKLEDALGDRVGL